LEILLNQMLLIVYLAKVNYRQLRKDGIFPFHLQVYQIHQV